MSAKPFALAVNVVIFDGQGRCLLIRRSAQNRNFGGCWEWPGGKLDPGEDFVAGLVRETREETGLEIEITGLAGATHFEVSNVRVVLLCMEAKATGGQLQLSSEHDASAWMALGELAGLALADQLRPFMLKYALERGAPP